MISLVAGCGTQQTTSTESATAGESTKPATATVEQPQEKPETVIATAPAQQTFAQPVAKIAPQTQFEPTTHPKTKSPDKIVKTDAEWRAILSPEEYQILRQKGTERAFTGKYDHHFKEGTYTCKGCGTALFDSTTKYNSGCGWPAFSRPRKTPSPRRSTAATA